MNTTLKILETIMVIAVIGCLGSWVLNQLIPTLNLVPVFLISVGVLGLSAGVSIIILSWN